MNAILLRALGSNFSTLHKALILSLCLFAPLGWADARDDTIAALRAQLEAISERLERLEAQQQASLEVSASTAPAVQATAEQVAEAKIAAANTLDRSISYDADFRYRFESFDIQDTPARHRNRVRARVGIKAPVTATTLLGFGLASGSDDPVSSHQSLGDDFSSKQVNIDQAYLRWQPTAQGMDVFAGKFKNPLYRAGGSGLLWDGDLRPEGVAVKYARDDLFVNALGTWINESKSGDDVLLLGAQLGLQKSILSNASLTTGVGYYQYTGIENSAELMPEKSGGNRLTAEGRYVSGFDLLEGFAQLKFPTASGSTTLYGSYVQNLAASDYDTGYILGAKLGIGDWSMGWAYQELEADAVYAILTDSDFAGGGTDSQGHKLSASYSLNKKVKLGATLFLNDRDRDLGNDEDYQRLMLDLVVKY
ncbi:MAG: hypothetical protein GWP70_12130 [Proteobacteria bacterium]|nr:hypothetical protein [Pseudomonadota bacterium]